MRRVLVLLGIVWAGATHLAAGDGSLSFVEDVIVARSATAPVTAEFRVRLSGADVFPVTAKWATQDLLATSPSDYASAAGDLTFNSNETQSIHVQVQADTAWEGAETFLVNLSDAVGAVIADGQAHGVIKDYGSPQARCDLSGDGRSDLQVIRRMSPPPNDPTTHYNGHEEWNLIGTVAKKVEGGAQQSGLPQLSHWQAIAANDFDGAGGCDILWQWKCTDGAHLYHDRFAMTPSLQAPGGPAVLEVLAPAADWELVGSGRFTPDTRADLLWWNRNTGALQIWESSGQGFVPSQDNPTGPAPNWQALAVLDIDNDGDADILWRNSASGALVYWRMQFKTHVDGGFLTPSSIADPCWQLVATGDFNGDGSDDIVWQNQNSQKSVVWFLRGAERIGGSYLSPDLFGDHDDTEPLKCPGQCQRDCSTEWRVVGPR